MRERGWREKKERKRERRERVGERERERKRRERDRRMEERDHSTHGILYAHNPLHSLQKPLSENIKF